MRGALLRLGVSRDVRSLHDDICDDGEPAGGAMKVDGRCLCGYLAYEAEVDPDSTLICNCTDCQVLSGSAFRVTVQVTGAFTFTSASRKPM